MSIFFSSDGNISSIPGGDLSISIIGGSQVSAVSYSGLPTASSGNAGHLYQITDFGYPYLLVQSTGAAWKQFGNFYCAWASLPSATTFAGYIGYTTISGVGQFRVESRLVGASYKWRPITSLHIFTFNDDSGTTVGPINPADETTILTGPVLPADFIQIKDRLELSQILIRGGTIVAGGGVLNVRMGTSDTPANNAAIISSTIAGTSNTIRVANSLSYISTATKRRQASVSNASGTSNETAVLSTATLESVAANAQKTFLTVQPGGTAETVTLYNATLMLHPGV